jgi:hypothetical protein
MPIVLVESSDTGKPAQGSRDFVTVERAEISVADGQLAIRVVLRFEKEAVAGAVHRFQTVRFVLARFSVGFPCSSSTFNLVHVIFVILPMARNLP